MGVCHHPVGVYCLVNQDLTASPNLLVGSVVSKMNRVLSFVGGLIENQSSRIQLCPEFERLVTIVNRLLPKLRIVVSTFAVLAMAVDAALADLYTGGVLSLEWIVDSSDTIVRVQLVADRQEGGKLSLDPQQVLKGELTTDKILAMFDAKPELFVRFSRSNGIEPKNRIQFRLSGTPHHWCPACRVHPGDQWFLFARSDKASPFQVFYAMNLHSPREFSGVAAVMSSGKALQEKKQIIAAVELRIERNHVLPKACQRDLIDRWTSRDGVLRWAEQSRRNDYFWSSIEVDSIRGGFAIDIENDYWDNPNPGDVDEDLILLQAIVPATVEFLPLLRQQVASTRGEAAMYALLNYPGEQTEALLEEEIENDSLYANTARRVLTHLRYRQDFDDPLNRRLTGRWNLYGQLERVELDFHDDHTCVVNVIPVRSGASTPYRLDGRGYWSIRDGHLWIVRSHIRRAGQWKMAPRWFFSAKEILEFDDRRIVLEGGPKMARP